ncbi:MAG: hypothetical protein JWQ90_642 [Hydrocarboniphaga sp.]|nr:hypothetical protein [Hydrocarboniphaga sp.]
MKTRKLWAAAAVLSAMTGAAIAAQMPPADKAALDARLLERGYQRGTAVDSIPDYRIDGWNSVDRRHLILSAGASRYYLLSLMTDCWDLSTAEDIGFTTTVSRLTRHDSVKLKAPGGAPPPTTCPIESIEQLNKVPKKKPA